MWQWMVVIALGTVAVIGYFHQKPAPITAKDHQPTSAIYEMPTVEYKEEVELIEALDQAMIASEVSIQGVWKIIAQYVMTDLPQFLPLKKLSNRCCCIGIVGNAGGKTYLVKDMIETWPCFKDHSILVFCQYQREGQSIYTGKNVTVHGLDEITHTYQEETQTYNGIPERGYVGRCEVLLHIHCNLEKTERKLLIIDDAHDLDYRIKGHWHLLFEVIRLYDMDTIIITRSYNYLQRYIGINVTETTLDLLFIHGNLAKHGAHWNVNIASIMETYYPAIACQNKQRFIVVNNINHDVGWYQVPCIEFHAR